MGGCFLKRSALVMVVFTLLLLLTAEAGASGRDRASSSTTPAAARKLLTKQQLSSSEARTTGPGECSSEDVVVSQSSANPLPSGVPAYTVQIANVCVGCAVSDVHVSCGDFASTELVDPGKFQRLGFNDCVVKGGAALEPGEAVSFQYSNSFPYQLGVASVACE